MKHRTQILLDPPQYEFLKLLSHREGRGLGEIIRQFIEEKRGIFTAKRRKDPLAKLIGCFRDSECTSENYKDYLYGKRKA